MKISKWAQPVSLLVATALVVGLAAPANAAGEDDLTAQVDVEVDTSGAHVGEASVTTSIESPLGLSGEAEVIADHFVLDQVHVSAETDGVERSDTYTISDLTIVDEEHFSATLTSLATGETEYIDTAAAEPQVLPIVLAIVARIGIQMAIRQFSKMAVQNAARQFALSLNTSKWAHITASKHNWRYVGATSRTKIADLMSKAIANGRATKSRQHIDYVWRHQNRTITVRTSLSGHISNGWVR